MASIGSSPTCSTWPRRRADPHRRPFKQDADGQRHRSRHHRAFHDPATVGLLLDNGAERLRRSLTDRGVPGPAVEEYLSVLGAPAALEAAVAWYRAVGALASVEVAPISVPTLYLWGDADHSVGASAARRTADFVTGPCRFEIVPGVEHFITDEAPDIVTAHVLEHIAAHP
jgi:pimeloyl-ACP methyl ester carboxylesterase